MLPGIRGMIQSGSGSLVFRGASNYNGSSASSHNITLPSYSVGDILVCMYVAGIGTTGFTGWTSFSNVSPTRRGFYRIATGSDTASVTLSSSNTLQGSIAAYGPTGGIDGTPTADSASGDLSFSAITVTVAGGFLIATSGTSDTVATPSGFVRDSLVTPNTQNIYFFSKLITSTGSTGSVTMDESGTAAHAGGMLYIKP